MSSAVQKSCDHILLYRMFKEYRHYEVYNSHYVIAQKIIDIIRDMNERYNIAKSGWAIINSNLRFV